MKFWKFFLSRLMTFIFVILIGVTTVFFIPRFMPSDPVENMIARLSARSDISPDQVQLYRIALTDTFGLEGTLLEQYFGFLKKVIVSRDFGPSLLAYPVPVMDLVARAMPWTFGLLMTTTVISWLAGNLIGLVVGFKKNKVYSRVFEAIAIVLYPLPYYVFALALIMLFSFVFPIFPLSMMIPDISWTWSSIMNIVHHSILPAMSLILVGLGWWVISAKTLVSGIMEEDYVHFAKLKGIKPNKIMFNYVVPNAALPQITILALQIGAVFNGALITEILFSYPGLGTLMYRGIVQADYNLIMATISISIIAVAITTFLIDMLYPIFDPRIRHK